MMLLGAGAVAEKTYVDDIFSTHLYTGNASARSINTGIDMTEGGLVWVKNRDQNYNHTIQDTVRGAGATKKLSSNLNNGENSGDTANHWAGYINSFNNNGFSIDKTGSGAINWANYNKSGEDYAAYNFRKEKGFLDILEFTETGSDATISHQLGSVPGMIIMKTTSRTSPWFVYHRGAGEGKWVKLNETGAATSFSSGGWGSVTSSSFNFTHAILGYGSSTKWIAYVFAGGKSNASEARSVDFDGSNDYLTWAASSDFAFGTGDYTVEFWVKPDSLTSNKTFFAVANTDGFAVVISSNKVSINGYSTGDKFATSIGPVLGQWTHYALVREGTGSNQTKIYKNGVLEKTGTDSTDWTTTAITGLGANASNGNNKFDGKISNFRVVKGTAVYTSSFRPPTEPLTNITNTKLLCCNDSSTTGSTVTPGTITAVGSPTASTDSPFDDPAGFVFGENEDQGVIKTGSYVGNGSTDGPDILMGWEPQYFLVKNISTSGSIAPWMLYDSMRGMVSGGTDTKFYPNANDQDRTNTDFDITSTGIKIKNSFDGINGDGDTFIYLAIRRPDGYVGKLSSLGTDVFAMDTGSGSSAMPGFDSGFPVDFALVRATASGNNWLASGRLIQKKYLGTSTTNPESPYDPIVFDSNTGWIKSSSYTSAHQSWMWKRHKGFDVVTYEGKGASSAPRSIPHSLSKPPEMIWTKNRDSSVDWVVWHKDLNGGGNNAASYYLLLNQVDQETSNGDIYGGANGTLPTSTHWTTGGNNMINENGSEFISILFASVDGISKCGGYSGSSSVVTVDCGFVPRLVIMKKRQNTGSSHNGWLIFDTLRGVVDGSDSYMFLDTSSAANADYDVLDLVDSGGVKGFSVPTLGSNNDNGSTYVFYAHA